MGEKLVLAVFNPLSGDHRAAQQAAHFAKKMGWQLELQAMIHSSEYSPGIFRLSETMKTARQGREYSSDAMMQELSDQLGFPGAPVRSSWETPFDEGALKAVEDSKPDLLVIALRDAQQPSSSEWRLISACPVPLLLLRTHEWSTPPVIMSCVDPSHAHDKPAVLDYEILRWGLRFAEAEATSLEVFHAAGMLPELGSADPYPGEYRKQVEQARLENLMPLLPEGAAEKLNFRFTHSSPVEGIRAFVDARKVDLCVLGSLSRSWLMERLIGGTLREILVSGGCDLLLINSPDTPGK